MLGILYPRYVILAILLVIDFHRQDERSILFFNNIIGDLFSAFQNALG